MQQPIRLQYIYRHVAPSRHAGLRATITARDLASSARQLTTITRPDRLQQERQLGTEAESAI